MKLSRSIRATVVIVVSAAMVTSCSGDSDSDKSIDLEQVAQGEALYQQDCASCHRADLSGDPNWKTPNADGSYPPPPHDSSGHTWHHPDQVLLEIIRDGSDFPRSRMPSFGDKLTDDDISAILEYFKSNWGPEERDYQRTIDEQETQREN